MAKTQTKTLKTLDVKTGATRVFYAGVGVNDLAVAKVRDYVADVQKKVAGVQKDVQKGVSRIDLDPKTIRTAIEARVAELQADAKAYPAKVQALVTTNVDTAADTYGDLVKRGQGLVLRIRRQESTKATVSAAQTTTAKAKTTTTQASKAASAQKTAAKKATKTATRSTTAKKKATAAKSSAKATATAAKKTADSATKAVADAAEKVGD